LNQLPASIGDRPFADAYQVTALIYEFEEPHPGDQPHFIDRSSLTYKDHLAKSKLWEMLER